MRNGPSGLFLSSTLLFLGHHHVPSDVQRRSLAAALLWSLRKALSCFYMEGGNGKKYHLPFLVLLCFQAGKFKVEISCGHLAGQRESLRAVQD